MHALPIAALVCAVLAVHADQISDMNELVLPVAQATCSAAGEAHALMGLNCVYRVVASSRAGAQALCAVKGGHLAHLYSRVQVFELMAKDVIVANQSYWLGIMPTASAINFELASLALAMVANPSVDTTEVAGTTPMDKFEPHIGFIQTAAALAPSTAATWKYFFATAPPSTPQVYSAQLEQTDTTTMLPALCQKADFGGKRFTLIATNEGISGALNVQLTVTGAPATTSSEHECAWWCMKADSRCHAFTWNVDQTCKYYELPIQYMPYNFLIDEDGTYAYDTLIMDMP